MMHDEAVVSDSPPDVVAVPVAAARLLTAFLRRRMTMSVKAASKIMADWTRLDVSSHRSAGQRTRWLSWGMTNMHTTVSG